MIFIRIGGATTIIGALIIGSLAFPDREVSAAWQLSSGVLAVGAALFGLFGVFLGFLLLLFRLAALKSLGEPYMYPLAPLSLRELLRDGVFRLPHWMERGPGPRRRGGP